MSKTMAATGDVLMVLHRAGGGWSAVTVRHDGRAASRPEIVETSRFASADAAALREHVATQRPARLLLVVPSANIVCRTSQLPNTDPDQLAEALALQAEAQLPASIPAHRVATGLLPMAAGETGRCGLTLAWPDHAPVIRPELGEGLPRPTFSAEVAAVAALLGRIRPADPLVWLDPETGSVAVAMTGAAGLLFRSTREAKQDPGDPERVGRMLAETALSIGHSGSYATSLAETYAARLKGATADGHVLVLPREVRDAVADRIGGTRPDDAWWHDYGIAVGAALAATGPLVTLTELVDEAIVETPSLVERVSTVLSRPRTAITVAVLCLVLIALAPIVLSALRVGILKVRHPDLESEVATVRQAQVELAMYDVLEKEGWSAAKILADIMCNTPLGIDLESIRLQSSDRSFSVAGIAKPEGDLTAPEVIEQMLLQLQETGVFRDVKVQWKEPTNFGHYEFDVSAQIKSPLRRVRYDRDRDFGDYTQAERRYGETDEPSVDAGGDGPPTGAVAAADPDPDPAPGFSSPSRTTPERTPPAVEPADDDRSPRRRPGASRAGALGGGPAEGRATVDRPGDAGVAPGFDAEPLTQAQIDAMSIEEVESHVSRVSEALNRARREDRDPELVKRLREEFNMLFKRMRAGQ